MMVNSNRMFKSDEQFEAIMLASEALQLPKFLTSHILSNCFGRTDAAAHVMADIDRSGGMLHDSSKPGMRVVLTNSSIG